MHIDENYTAHGTCRKYQGTSHQKLEIDLIYDNLRAGQTVLLVAQKGSLSL